MGGIFPPGPLGSSSVSDRRRYAPPLWVKVWLLLALNFALLLALGTAWFLGRSARGWERLALGPLGDRVAALADNLATELWTASPAQADAAVARYARRHGADFLWLRNDGRMLAGAARTLPEPVARELARTGPPRPPAGGPPPRPEDAGPEGGPPVGPRGAPGRFLIRTPDGDYWFGLRLHPNREMIEEGATPPHTTLLVHTDSSWAFARLLGLDGWLAVLAGALGLSVLFWLPFVRSITRRLDALTRATDRIAEGRFETRAAGAGADEIGRLGQAINSLAGRLESHQEAQKRFLGDVAHELGSPLGRLLVAVELLEQRVPPDLRAAVGDVREEVQLMAGLVNELLAFTRAGLRPPDAAREPVALAPLVADVLPREDALDVAAEVPPDAVALGDPALLRRAIGNLVRNAKRYGAAPVTLQVRRGEGTVTLRVEDAGPGVPPDALARLGEPFFRPESARSRETGGVGLGLTIVRSSVAACGGEVTFRNREPHGFCAEITLTAA